MMATAESSMEEEKPTHVQSFVLKGSRRNLYYSYDCLSLIGRGKLLAECELVLTMIGAVTGHGLINPMELARWSRENEPLFFKGRK